MIKSIGNLEEFNSIIKEQKNNANKLYIIFYTASWCYPCKTIYPLIERLNTKISTIYKVDVDNDSKEDEEDANKISVVNEITCMPTFHLYKNGEIVKKITGSNKKELLEEIKINLKSN